MAVSTGRKLVKGSDIMLFAKDGNTYKSIAHGTSHSLSLSADTEEISTKDTGIYGMTEVNRLTWSIQADHMYTRDGYDTFFNLMTAMEPVTVVFGLKADAEIAGTPADVNISADGNWTMNTTYVYSGKAIITALDWNADAGSKATMSVTLAGQGSISKGQPASE